MRGKTITDRVRAYDAGRRPGTGCIVSPSRTRLASRKPGIQRGLTMKRQGLLGLGLAAVMAVTLVGLPLRAADEPIDYDAINKIKAQGLSEANSKVMEVSSYLTDVYGPRLTGSPNVKAAGDWAVKQMQDWGLTNV